SIPSSGIRAALQRPASGVTAGREKVALRPGMRGRDDDCAWGYGHRPGTTPPSEKGPAPRGGYRLIILFYQRRKPPRGSARARASALHFAVPYGTVRFD